MVVPTDAYEMLAALLGMAMAMYGLVKLSQSPICKALAHRISGENADGRVADIEDSMERLEAQVLDYQERLDFAERMISRGGAAPPLEESDWEATSEEGIATPV